MTDLDLPPARTRGLLAALAAGLITVLCLGSPAHAAPAPAGPKPAAPAPAAAVPDLTVTIPAGSDEDTPYPLGTDITIDYLVVVRAKAASAANTLTITVPRGLVPDVDSGVFRYDGNRETRLKCTQGAAAWTCPLGALAKNRPVDVDVPLVARKDAPAGTSAPFTVSATPDAGADPKPDDNGVQGTVRFLGTAHMAISITGPRRTVTVGHKIKVRITVTNRGPQPAPATLGFLGLEEFLDSNFTVLRFSGRDVPPGGGGGGIGIGGAGSAGGGASTGRASVGSGEPAGLRTARSTYRQYRTSGEYTRHQRPGVRSHDLDPLLFWDAGDLAVGRSRTAVLTLRADKRGKGTVFAYGFSDAGDPPCNTTETDPEKFQAPPGCDGFDEFRLRAVKPKPKPQPKPTPPRRPDRAATDPIAATGPDSTAHAAVGGSAVLVGVLLLVAGRRRRRS